jgi:hypothetical protein
MLQDDNSNISNSYNIGAVRAATIDVTDSTYCACSGGIAGAVGGTIEKSYNNGDVEAESNNIDAARVGGIAGRSSAKLTDCAAVNRKVTVSGTATTKHLGQIIGEYREGNVLNNFANDNMQPYGGSFATGAENQGKSIPDGDFELMETYSNAGGSGLEWDFTTPIWTWDINRPILYWQ